jgi:hypothetical protein
VEKEIIHTLGTKYLVLGPGLFKLPPGFKGDTKAAITEMLKYHLKNEKQKTKNYEITKIDETTVFLEHNIYKHILNVMKKQQKLSINCSIGMVDTDDGEFEYYDRIE